MKALYQLPRNLHECCLYIILLLVNAPLFFLAAVDGGLLKKLQILAYETALSFTQLHLVCVYQILYSVVLREICRYSYEIKFFHKRQTIRH